MRKPGWIAATLAACLVLAPPSWAQTARRATPTVLAPVANPEQVGFDSQRLARLDAYMAQAVTDGRVAGMTTLLVRHGKIVSLKTYGQRRLAPAQPMTEDTIFRIYSMTKPVTGVAMMMLFEEGKWRLDDPVTRHIPEFRDLKVMTGLDNMGRPILEAPKRPPTMREIMSHTAGFGYGLQAEHYVDKQYREKNVLSSNGLKEMIDRTATVPLIYQPGESWRYSSVVEIQGYIVEKLSGQKFGDFLRDRIFRPLRMNDTGFYVTPDKAGRLSGIYTADRQGGPLTEATTNFGRPLATFREPPPLESGGGGLVSTTMDYARFCQMLLNKGELDGVRLLSPATVELMGANVIPRNVLVTSNGTSAQRFNEAVGFGLDFMVVMDPRAAGSLEGKGTMSWSGAAGTWFWVDPTNDLFFIGMIQRVGGAGGGGDLGQAARTLVYQALVDPAK